MDIDELYAALPRPQEPRESGRDEDWLRAAEQIGTRPPVDYVYYINSYGSGRINGFLWVFNPFSKDPNLNLVTQMMSILGAFRESREQSPEDCPYPLYFEPGGILPWGASDDGDYYFWLTKGSPDKWPVVTVPRHADTESFDMPMSLFIARALRGQLSSGAIPGHFAEEAVFTPLAGA
jgi:hypothetical protein